MPVLNQGPYSPTIAESVGTGVPWYDALYSVIDCVRACDMLDTCCQPTNPPNPPDTYDQSQDLYVSGFGFSVPARSRIVGVKVEYLRFANHPSVGVDRIVALSVDGSENRADPSYWDAEHAMIYQVRGGPTDIWGCALTPAKVNDPAFGAKIGLVLATELHLTSAFSINHVRMTVYYEPLPARRRHWWHNGSPFGGGIR